MASATADTEQLQGQLPEGSTTGRTATPEREELRSAEQDAEMLSSGGREMATGTILRIATAVEKIFSCIDKPSTNKADPDHKPILQPTVERLALSDWTSSAFIVADGLQKKESSVLTAFFTEGPGLTHPDLEAARKDVHDDEDLSAVYSKDKWNTAPQRVFIHSPDALHELQTMTKTPLRARPTGMIPPFKLLIHHRQTIKSRLDELKQTNRDHERPESSASTAADSTSQTSLVDHLECIYNFIHTDLSNYIGLDLRLRNGNIHEVLFEEVYHLFKPGDLVLAATTGEDQLYRVCFVSGGRMRLSDLQTVSGPNPPPPRRWRTFGTGPGTWTDVRVISYIMAWDGENIGPRQTTHTISYFAGARRVTDLGLYPIQFHEDHAGLRSRLRARGRKLIKCSGHKRYTGESATVFFPLQAFVRERTPENDSSDDSDDEQSQHGFRNTDMVRSDIYVDYKAYYTSFFATKPELSILATFLGDEAETFEVLGNQGKSWNFNDNDVDAHRSDNFLSKNRHQTKYGKPKENLDDDQDRLELLPGQVPAFVFNLRKWKWLTLDLVEDLDKSQEAKNSGWNELVIPNRFSSLLLSLVSNHISGMSSRQWETSSEQGPKVQIDLVRGKGRGLIILLHGPPGSGKTSTAETIAAYTGRPLYAITCGDIGTKPNELERNLAQHTRLAEKWDCVLLLDEADVFLMSRTYDDMHRNAMVSVFLRELEYYSGILFLTTNIVGVMDEAFKSRIHIALEYPALDEKSTLEIWTNLLQRIQRDNRNAEVKIRFDEEALLRYAKTHYRKHHRNGTTWNGRQIRNVFQTAIGIGQYERLKKIQEAEKRGEAPDRSTRTIKLTVASFKTVAETANDFEKYITKTRGDDRERAAMHHFRRDDRSRSPPPKKSYRTPASMYQTDQDAGASRAAWSRRYAGESASPAPRRSVKGREVHGKAMRATHSVSDDEEHTGGDMAKSHDSDVGSIEDIIEQDLDEEEDEDE